MPPQAFISRARAGRVFAGEPMASGLQASNVTSAIRSQMISSTSGIHGAKAGTSKEVHGLKRQVLDKGAAYSQDGASRRLQDLSTELTSGRSVISRQNSKSVTVQEEDTQQKAGGQVKKAVAQPMKSKKDLRPGYCENCQDKFRDFDEVSFASLQHAILFLFCYGTNMKNSIYCLVNIESLPIMTITGRSLTIYLVNWHGCPEDHPDRTFTTMRTTAVMMVSFAKRVDRTRRGLS